MASTPPPLMKKHSQTDLVSRLKSRKMLGVGGEDDDGEVHRSKYKRAKTETLQCVGVVSHICSLIGSSVILRLLNIDLLNPYHETITKPEKFHNKQHHGNGTARCYSGVFGLSAICAISKPNNLTFISQMLGNETKFAGREPIGLRLWLLISAVLFTSTSLMALAFPNQFYEIIFELTTSRISIRLYGGALLCISLILWNGLYTAEKVIIQWTLLTEACYFGVQFLVTSITLLEMGTLSNSAIVLLLGEIFSLLITLSYYHHLGRRTKKI